MDTGSNKKRVDDVVKSVYEFSKKICEDIGYSCFLLVDGRRVGEAHDSFIMGSILGSVAHEIPKNYLSNSARAIERLRPFSGEYTDTRFFRETGPMKSELLGCSNTKFKFRKTTISITASFIGKEEWLNYLLCHLVSYSQNPVISYIEPESLMTGIYDPIEISLRSSDKDIPPHVVLASLYHALQIPKSKIAGINQNAIVFPTNMGREVRLRILS